MLDKHRHSIDLVVALSGGYRLASPVHPHQSLEKARSLSSDSDGRWCGQLRRVDGTDLDLLYLILERRDTLYLFVHSGLGVGHAGGHLGRARRCLDDGRRDRLERRARGRSVHARVGVGDIAAGDGANLAARVLEQLLGNSCHDRCRLEHGGLLDDGRGRRRGLEAVLRQERLKV